MYPQYLNIARGEQDSADSLLLVVIKCPGKIVDIRLIGVSLSNKGERAQ